VHMILELGAELHDDGLPAAFRRHSSNEWVQQMQEEHPARSCGFRCATAMLPGGDQRLDDRHPVQPTVSGGRILTAASWCTGLRDRFQLRVPVRLVFRQKSGSTRAEAPERGVWNHWNLDFSAPRKHPAAPALGCFLVGVALVLAVDLKVSTQAAVHFGRALWWRQSSGIVLSVGFGFFVWFPVRRPAGPGILRRDTCWEKSLSVDNLFVFVLLFPQLRHSAPVPARVLFWGVLGAHRAPWHAHPRGRRAGATLPLDHRRLRGHPRLYSLEDPLPQRGGDRAFDNAVVRWVARKLPHDHHHRGVAFLREARGPALRDAAAARHWSRRRPRSVFALDSIPAVFAVTTDPFLVFSSNICALLGLRALYFVVRGALARAALPQARPGGDLIFVGLKMLLFKWVDLPTGTSLLIIAAILVVALVFSLLRLLRPTSRAESFLSRPPFGVSHPERWRPATMRRLTPVPDLCPVSPPRCRGTGRSSGPRQDRGVVSDLGPPFYARCLRLLRGHPEAARDATAGGVPEGPLLAGKASSPSIRRCRSSMCPRRPRSVARQQWFVATR